jgi:hypothetical protein
MTKARRRAFTRIDLAAVIAVVGVLAMLALPALQRGRAEATRASCSDNLRRIALAVRGFESTNNGELIRNLYGPQLAGPGDPAAFGGLTLLLPYLEEEALFHQYNFTIHMTDPGNQSVTRTHLPVFRCVAATPGRLSLPGNSPRNPDWRGAISDYASIRWFELPLGPAHDPIGLGAFEQRLSVPEVSQVRVYSSMITDGMSNTIGHVERAGMPDVWVKGKRIDDGTSVNSPVGDEPRGPWAGYSCVNLNTYSDDGMKSLPAGRCTINCRNTVGQFNQGGVYGFHAGGAYASFMDGSVRFLREGMSPYVLFALGSRAGGEVISPEDY